MLLNKVSVPSYTYTPSLAFGHFHRYAPGTTTLAAGTQLNPNLLQLPVDIIHDKDVAMHLRDGTKIYVDIFRPPSDDTTAKCPAIVAWSPYGKSSGATAPRYAALYGMLGLDPKTSGLEKFEGPDPAFWCARGYAVCNPDPRGIAKSEGDSVMFGRQEGQDCYDLIEWLAEQDWCTGKVGMSGTSYLAVSQWFTAAEQPPHLAAINPCEGFSNIYRDLVFRGGMRDTAFTAFLERNYVGDGQRESISEEAMKEPLMCPLWEDKIAQFTKITVPAYVVASYSNALHTEGTFRAWRHISSKEKWLRIHNSQEWPDYYDEKNKADLLRFFDHFLKGADNDWTKTPKVRYALHDFSGGDRLLIPATEFPPSGVSISKQYLDGTTRSLKRDVPSVAAVAIYSGKTGPGLASFAQTVEREQIFVGYAMVNLWVELRDTDDADLFFLLQKLDVHGNHLQHFTVSNHGAMMHDLTARGASILRYKGPYGHLRVSARHLDHSSCTEAIPSHTFDRIEKMARGECVEIKVDLAPIGMILYPGESLRLVVSSVNPLGAMMPAMDDATPLNDGSVIIHTGPNRPSYLQIPTMSV